MFGPMKNKLYVLFHEYNDKSPVQYSNVDPATFRLPVLCLDVLPTKLKYQHTMKNFWFKDIQLRKNIDQIQ